MFVLLPLASHPQAVHFVEKVPRTFSASHHCVHVKNTRHSYGYVCCQPTRFTVQSLVRSHALLATKITTPNWRILFMVHHLEHVWRRL